MTTDTKKHKIRPSSSGWAFGRSIEAEYSSACLRYMLVAQKALFKDIDPVYAKIGAHHEDLYAQKLGDTLQHREFVMKSEIMPGVEFSGRCDFITTDGTVHETKASFSKNFLYSVINKGSVKKSHLAQLVSYLIELKQTKGKIVAGYYEEAENGDYVQQGYREFDVEIDSEGRILVDGAASGYTVHNQMAFRLLAAETLSKQLIRDRPSNSDGFISPCNYCPMARLCDKYDAGQITDTEYIEEGVRSIDDAPPMKAKVNKVSVKRRSKK